MHDIIFSILAGIFFVNAIYFFAARVVFIHLLKARGVKIVFGLSGLPFYYENLYYKADRSIKSEKIDKLLLSMKVSFFIGLAIGLSLILVIHY